MDTITSMNPTEPDQSTNEVNGLGVVEDDDDDAVPDLDKYED